MSERVTPQQLQALMKESSKPRSKNSPKRIQYEHAEQVAFFEWRDTALRQIPLLSSMHANPSGGWRPDKVGKEMKHEGSTIGLLDVTWPLPRGKYMGFYFELKAQYADGRHNKPSKPQNEWIRYFTECGYYADWGVGWEAMRDAALKYYEQGPSIYLPEREITPLNVAQFSKKTTYVRSR